MKEPRFSVAPVEPVDATGVRTVLVGTAIWGVAFLALLPFYGHLESAGHAWWLWTCLVGFALGLLGYEWLRWRARHPSEDEDL